MLTPVDMLPWTTPTKRAEAAYQAERAKRPSRARKRLIGAAGLPVPDAREVCQKADGALLAQHVEAAAKALRAALLPAEEAERVADLIGADLRERFPPADMAVLHRYGFAARHVRILIEFSPYDEAERLHVLPAVSVPARWPGYVARMPDAPVRMGDARVAVPDATVAYFHRVIETRAIIRDEIRPAAREATLHAARTKAQPTWGQIEAAWPRFGAWMAAQRETLK